MSLADMIRGRVQTAGFATATLATVATPANADAEASAATLATPATLEGDIRGTVARVATVAVASLPESKTVPSGGEDGCRVGDSPNADEEALIRAWLAHIRETDPDIVTSVVDRCRANRDARTYFLNLASEARPPAAAGD